MIIDDKISINITNRNISYYKNIGYSPIIGIDLIIDIKDLPQSSHVKLNIICDNIICSKQLKKSYKDYNRFTKNKTEPYYCKDCKTIKTNITNKERYGCINVFGSEQIKEQIKKTNKERYGCEYVLSSELIIKKSQAKKLERYDDINYRNNKKTRKTLYERYGYEFPIQVKEFKSKIIETNKEKYKTEYVLSNENIRSKISITNNINTYNKYYDINDSYNILSYENNIFKMIHLVCGYSIEMDNKTFHNRKISNEYCDKCFPITHKIRSTYEQILINDIKEIDPSIIIVENNRTVLKGKELDIYLPSIGIAIEINGLYWHSDKFYPKDYHLNKTNICRDENIDMMHIFEDDFVYRYQIILSMIKKRIVEKNREIVNYTIRIIEDIDICNEFLLKNHLLGPIYEYNDNISIGLFIDDKLSSIICMENNMVIRYCDSISNTYISTNTFKLLIESYIQNFKCSVPILISIDNSLFEPNYIDFMTYVDFTEPNFHFIKNMRRIDPNDNISNLDIYQRNKIYNCGYKNYIYIIKRP